MLSPRQIRVLGVRLYPRSNIALDGALRRFASYRRLELQTPRDERFHRVYKGVHSSRRDRVILHLYDLSATDELKAKAKARREFDSLHRLQLHKWAPRILDSFQDAPGHAGEVKFFTVADPGAPSIEERASDNSWDTQSRLSYARSTFQALAKLHTAGVGDEPMLHRNLTPNTILVKHDNSPILTGFEHARIPEEVTVASATTSEYDVTVSPEVRTLGRGAADRRSDVFSLCASLTVLFKGREDETSSEVVKALNPDYSWNMLIRASNPAFSCGRSPVSLEPLSIRLNRLKNRAIEPVINRLPARGIVIRRQVDFPVRNSHRFGPFHGPDASSVHYPGAQDTRASLFHNRFQSVAP